MNTPIADFVRGYEKKNMVRLHMPGHKGKAFLGCEAWDITEVSGADALYEADGIIAESEVNASKLFGTGKTLYSTEGSSQCIRAMLYLMLQNASKTEKPIILAARNVHKSFVQAVALLDIEVEWIYPEGNMRSLCCCEINAKQLEMKLNEMTQKPIGVYVTSPDYLGGQLDVKSFAKICHQYEIPLAVDNAHGAYLHFLKERRHPIDLGADICCDSAHKTMPVLTGGAYLQIHKDAPTEFLKNARQAMSLFGSTSPSYLTLISLDLCNAYLADEYTEKLQKIIERLDKLRSDLRNLGWQVEETDPLKLTVRAPKGMTGIELAVKLRRCGGECEYADPEFVVFMFTPENEEKGDRIILDGFGKNNNCYNTENRINPIIGETVMSIRNAVFAKQKTVSVTEALGCICASPTVSCPPAIPIVISGERISKEAIQLFEYYGIEKVDVIE